MENTICETDPSMEHTATNRLINQKIYGAQSDVVLMYKYQGCSIMEKIIITNIFINIEVTIIQTIIFEFEIMMYLFSMSLPKTLCNWEL